MERFWGSKKNVENNKKQESVQIIEVNHLLPNQIGCKIIQLEMEIMQTQNLTKELILELLHQYSRAVQFYEERGSPKYLLYQKKLQSFLAKPAINEILNGKTGTMLIKKQKNEEQLKKVQTQSQLVAKQILENCKQSGQKQVDIIKKQIQNQQKLLQQRIQRKRANSNRSNRQKITSASFSVPSKHEQNEKYQNILVSQFMQLPNPNHNNDTKTASKVFL